MKSPLFTHSLLRGPTCQCWSGIVPSPLLSHYEPKMLYLYRLISWDAFHVEWRMCVHIHVCFYFTCKDVFISRVHNVLWLILNLCLLRLVPFGIATRMDPIPSQNINQMPWQGFLRAVVMIPNRVLQAGNTAPFPLQRFFYVPFPLPVWITDLYVDWWG